MRVPTILALAAVVLLLPSVALAAPARDSVSLNDPAIDADESAFVSDLCGFAIDADVSGHIGFVTLGREGSPGTSQLNLYDVHATYTNPANGNVVRLRDIGPDRFYVQDGVAYVAVTGRSETGSGIVGVVKIDLATGEVVHQAGNDIGVLYDRICAALA
jgi:hypothetical protein